MLTDSILTSSVFFDQERLTNHFTQITQATTFKITFKVFVFSLYLSENLSDISINCESQNLAKLVRTPLSQGLCSECNALLSAEV